jgi:pilus assembly protein CpaF
MNTGHEGGAGTLHANSAVDVPNRVASLAMTAGLPRDAALNQLASAVDVVVHLHRPRRGRRRVRDVGVLVRQGVEVVVEQAVTFDADLGARTGPGLDRLEELLSR